MAALAKAGHNVGVDPPPEDEAPLVQPYLGNRDGWGNMTVVGHPSDEYNGLYQQADDWNGQPHFINERSKHLYYYAQNEGGEFGWSFDGRNQSKYEMPGAKDWYQGGWIRCKDEESCSIEKVFISPGAKSWDGVPVEKDVLNAPGCSSLKCLVKFILYLDSNQTKTTSVAGKDDKDEGYDQKINLDSPDGDMSVEWNDGYYEGAVYLEDQEYSYDFRRTNAVKLIAVVPFLSLFIMSNVV